MVEMPNVIAERRVDRELIRAAKDAAAKAGVSFAAVYRTALERLLAEGHAPADLADICQKWDDEAYQQRAKERRARELLEQVR
jgi:antitoxin component of RelBE/YafQ-DinJ toxin-antitoxin module